MKHGYSILAKVPVMVRFRYEYTLGAQVRLSTAQVCILNKTTSFWVFFFLKIRTTLTHPLSISRFLYPPTSKFSPTSHHHLSPSIARPPATAQRQQWRGVINTTAAHWARHTAATAAILGKAVTSDDAGFSVQSPSLQCSGFSVVIVKDLYSYSVS